MLNRIFGAKRAEVTGVWRKLRKTSNLFCILKCYRVSNSRRSIWTQKIARMRDMSNTEIEKVRDNLGDLSLDGRVILKRPELCGV
jgi:hypothetical protein